MEMVLVGVLVVGILVFVLVSRKGSRVAPTSDEELQEPSTEEIDFEDLNEKFFEKAKGREARRLVRVFSTFEKDQLRSLLDSCDIPTYSEFENLNSLLPGLGIYGYSESYISVLVDDIQEATAVVKEYIEDRRSELRAPAAGGSGLGESVTRGLLAVDGFTGSLPELLGQDES